MGGKPTLIVRQSTCSINMILKGFMSLNSSFLFIGDEERLRVIDDMMTLLKRNYGYFQRKSNKNRKSELI